MSRIALFVLLLVAAAAPLLGSGCDDGDAGARCEAVECPLMTACEPQTGRCVAPDTVPFASLTGDPSLAIDPATGALYLAGYAAAEGDLLFGQYDRQEGRFRMQAVDTEGDVGRDAALALFPDGRPAIAYVDVDAEQLKFAFYNDRNVWQSETIDPRTRAVDVDLVIDADGTPHLAWRDENQRILRYARRVDRRWRIENVDLANDRPERITPDEACPEAQRRAVNQGVGQGSRIAVQGTTPVISYHDADCGSLRVARIGASGQWTLRVLDGWSAQDYARTGPLPEPETRVGRFSDIAVDALGQLTIVYFDATRGELRAASLEGDSRVVDSGLRDDDAVKHIVGQQPSLAFDPSGRPVVAHLDAASHALLISEGSASAWHTEPLVAGPPGFDNDLVVAADGTRYLVGVDRTRTSGTPRVQLAILPPP